ncbi:MAG: repeat protein [Verrucomicrobiales bacterium]|nr:repeat protein [Verrucomicrobiales bacterium]
MRPVLYSALCCSSLLTLPARAVPGAEETVDKAAALKASDPATRLLGMKIHPFAKAPQVQSGTALTVTDDGLVYVCETYRFANGVEDNRQHTNWIMDDLAVKNLEERRSMLKRYEAEFTPGYFTAQADRVVRLADKDGDGTADESLEFAGGFRDMVDGPAIGVLQGLNANKDIYLACSPKIWRLVDADGDGKAEQREVLLDGLGIRTSLSGHDLHGLVWGPDGMLYFSMGDRGYHFTTKDGATFSSPDTGAAFRCRPDGTGVEMIYHGLRNPQELAFNEYGDLFTVDNNCDQGDGARICWLMEGGESGWHIGHQALTTYKAYLKEGGFSQPPHWLSEKLWQPAHAGQPLWILPPLMNFTDGPSGLTFTSGQSLPDRYQNSFFIADYKGAPSQCFLWNFKVSREGAGYRVTDEHLFHTGIPNSDVDFGPDGKLYVVDFGGGWAPSGAGAVYTMEWPEGQARPLVAQTAELLKKGVGNWSVSDLCRLLGHPDSRVRLRASVALGGRGAEAVEPVAATVMAKSGLPKLQGIWTLGQLKAVGKLRPLLADPDAETRAQAAKTLGLLRDRESGAALRGLLADASPRVRGFASIALGRVGDAAAVADGLRMIETQGAEDPFLRHAGVMILTGCAKPAELTALANHPSQAVRLSALLALRRLADAGAGAFLTDADPAIAAEAVRAIADVPIPSARPALRAAAALLTKPDAPAFLSGDADFRRILRSLQVEGNAPAALLLTELAGASALPAGQRLLALLTLRNFVSPPPIDPTNGLWRPLDPRDPGMVRSAVETRLAGVLDEAQGEVKASALTLTVQLGVPVAPDKLSAWAADASQPAVMRLSALAQLPADRVLAFAGHEMPELRAAASLQAAAAFPGKAAGLARDLIQRGTAPDLLGAYQILAAAPGAEAVEVLTGEIARMAAGGVPEAQRLDLLEAAGRRAESEVKEKVAAYEAALVKAGHSVFDLALQGGDAARGREVFANQGTCMKCHRAEGEGGKAGPRLTGLALRLPPAAMLESVVNPNAVIVPGFGVTAITLNDGTTVVGTILEETPALVKLRTPEGETHDLESATIREKTPAISPMPPLGLSLSKQDLRDLMAFLKTLTTPPPVLK